MKTTRTVLLLVLSCFLLSSKCGKYEYTPPCTDLQLDNHTDKTLYVLISYDYPDTSLNFQNPRVNPYTDKIPAHSKGKINAQGNSYCLEAEFDYLPMEKISIFVFDAALIGTTPWNIVRQNYLVLKRFDLKKDEISNNNYTITVP